MKLRTVTFATVIFFGSLSALAQVKSDDGSKGGSKDGSETVACDARDILPGSGLQGRVEFSLATLSASLTPPKGDKLDIIASDSVCGTKIKDLSCATSDTSTALTDGREMNCVDKDLNMVTSASLVVDRADHNGRVECQSPDARHVLEISNCK